MEAAPEIELADSKKLEEKLLESLEAKKHVIMWDKNAKVE